jgi:hypothetical protein
VLSTKTKRQKEIIRRNKSGWPRRQKNLLEGRIPRAKEFKT